MLRNHSRTKAICSILPVSVVIPHNFLSSYFLFEELKLILKRDHFFKQINLNGGRMKKRGGLEFIGIGIHGLAIQHIVKHAIDSISGLHLFMYLFIY